MADDTKVDFRKAFRLALEEIATRPQQSHHQPVPSDAEVAELTTAFRDAVLWMYNNALRVCGIPVGDATSESNSMMLWDKVGVELDRDIGDGLAAARRDEIARLEADAAAAAAAIDRLTASAQKAFAEAHALDAALTHAKTTQETLARRIAALKELV